MQLEAIDDVRDQDFKTVELISRQPILMNMNGPFYLSQWTAATKVIFGRHFDSQSTQTVNPRKEEPNNLRTRGLPFSN